MALPPLILPIIASSQGVKTGVTKAQAELKGFRGFVKQNAGFIGIALAGAAVAFGASAVKSFNESEAAIAQTNAVLKSTKGIAGVTSGEVTKLATAMQKMTTFSDEQVRSAENLLLTFTAISDDIFPETTQAVLDMSQALGQDLKSSSIQLGKALNDPILGLTSLSRVGVRFTQETKDQIKAMVESGDVMGAQKVILHELATEFGGSAKKAAKTFGGQTKQLANQMDDLKEQVGKLIVSLGKYLVPVISFVIKAISKMVANLEIMIGAVIKASVWVGRKFVAAWKAVSGPVLAVIHGITNAVLALVHGIEAAVSWIAKLGSADVPTINGHPAIDIGGVRGSSVGKAGGGPVSAWRPYVVGEKGPELFVPQTNGTIVPNGTASGSPMKVHVALDRKRWVNESDYEVSYGGV